MRPLLRLGALILLALVPELHAQYSFEYGGSLCDARQYFDISGLLCQSCGDFSVPRDDGLGCTCLPGYRLSLPTDITAVPLESACVSCLQSGRASSGIGNYCVTCDNTNGTYWSAAQLFNATDADTGDRIGDCQCLYGDGEILEVDSTGTPFTAVVNGTLTYYKRCVKCPTNSVVYRGKCYSCDYPKVPSLTADGPTCVCAAGTTCIDGSDIDVVSRLTSISMKDYDLVTFRDVKLGNGFEGDVSVVSRLFQELLPSNARKCAEEADRVACQVLANLCVLQMYDYSTPACAIFRKLALDRGDNVYYPESELPWSISMPWLFYEATDPYAFLEADDVALRTVLKDGKASDTDTDAISRLSIVASVYTLNGTWLGLRPLTSQLNLCGTSLEDAKGFPVVGQNYVVACNLDMPSLTKLEPSPNGLEFYELFMYDGPDRLYPLPIINFDMRDSKNLVNRGNVEPTLVRRFFLYDRLTGLQDSESSSTTRTGSSRTQRNTDADTTNTLPAAIRFISDARLIVKFRADETGAIFPPYLELRYTQQDTSLATDVLALLTHRISFQVKWVADAGRYWKFSEGTMVTCFVLAGVYWLLKMNSIMRLRKDANIDLAFMYRGVAEGADVFGNAVLIYLWVNSMYWLGFFKTQTSSYAMIPDEGKFGDFRDMIIVATILKIFGVIDMIRRQLNYDVIFLDWEKPKKLLAAGGAKEVLAPTSCWRTMMIANEWNELQSTRKTNPGFTFLLVLALLEGAKWGGIGLMTPDQAQLDPKPYLTTHFVLRFAIASLVYLGVAGVQIVLKSTVIRLYFNDPLGNFVDLCYLANVSVFALHERCAGYYIHGRNAMRMSDTDFLGLSEELHKEEQQSVAARGLVPSHGDKNLRENQSFEVYIDAKTRFAYEDTLVKTLERALELQKQATGLLGRLKSPELASSAQLQAMRKASVFVKHLVAEVEANFAERVQKKGLLQRVIPAPPQWRLGGMSTSVDPPMLLVHDLNHRFGHLFLFNKELSISFMEFLIFMAVDQSVKSYPAAAFVAYLCSRVLRSVRQSQGTNNVSRKSLIDARFLI